MRTFVGNGGVALLAGAPLRSSSNWNVLSERLAG